uniref:Uncharacterized protein n=1 Tax=Romanomermis culicivorax TaxID=13658 RepID=A0A915KD98_ROMCU
MALQFAGKSREKSATRRLFGWQGGTPRRQNVPAKLANVPRELKFVIELVEFSNNFIKIWPRSATKSKTLSNCSPSVVSL